jgi:hypothetical protein
VNILGRVLFTAKSEPAIDWSEIEFRFQEISAPARSSDLPVEPSATLAHDPAFADEPPVTSDPPITNHLPITSDSPVMNSGDPLSQLGEGTVSASPRQTIPEFPMGIEAHAPMPVQSASAFNRVPASSN